MTSLVLNTNNATPFNQVLASTSATISMTSQQIADLVQSRHDDVKRSIERLINSGVIAQPPMADGIKSANGVVPKHYVFEGDQGERDTTIIVAQLSPQFLGEIVDQWRFLKQQMLERVRPSYMIEDPIERAKKWIEEATAKQAIENKLVEAVQVIEIQAPKAEVFDAVLDKSRTYTIREFAQRTGVKEKTVKQWLADKLWMTGTDAKSYKPLARANVGNYMRMMKTGKTFTDRWGIPHHNEVIMFTQNGFEEAVRKMVKSGMMKPLAESVAQADNYALQA